MTKLLWKTFIFIISFIIIVRVLFDPSMLFYTIPFIIILTVILLGLYKFGRPYFDKMLGFLKVKTPELTKNVSQKTTGYIKEKSTEKKNKKLDLDKLEEMHKLVEKGVLTQEEFNKKKEEML